MTRIAGTCVVIGLISVLTACGVGDEGGGDDGGGDDGTPIPVDPNPDKIVCSGAFTVTGSWTAADPLRPADKEGCWPVGTWTFTATIDNAAAVPDITGDGKGERCGQVAGTAAPTLLASYSFRVDRTDPGDGFVESYTVLSETAPFFEAKASVNASGNAICEGHLELTGTEKKQYWNLRPTIEQAADGTTLTVTGSGEYTLFIDAH